jgi:two-component system, chemotaxis family, chemotaxis protein CheY
MKNIWIVDDDEEMTRAIQLMLKLLDYTTTAFLGARPAAQTLLSGKQPDLMILDINMPEVSGLDMLEFVRRRQEWNDVPILMLSTEAADVTVDKAMELGADGYVSKPVTIEELEKALNEAFQKHQKGSL